MSGIIAQNTLDNSGLIKSPAGGGAWTFIKKLTASSSSDLSFEDGTSDVVLDGTYAEYIFYFVNIHAQTANAEFTFNGSTDTGSNYNTTKTSTYVETYHAEADDGHYVKYQTGLDLAQSTSFNNLSYNVGIDNDKSTSGYLHLFNPSSTTFVKHFIAEVNWAHHTDGTHRVFVAGYMNTTSAVDAIRFEFNSGNIDAGSIFLHGLTI